MKKENERNKSLMKGKEKRLDVRVKINSNKDYPIRQQSNRYLLIKLTAS